MRPWGMYFLNKTNLYSLGPTSTAHYKFSHQIHVRFEKSSEKETNSMTLSITKQHEKQTDSLLTLMEKTPEEQRLVFEDYIKALKKADSLQLVKQESQQQLASNNSFFEGDFYFYNRSMRARGESEFYRIWGNIKKTDNWRYSSSESVELAEMTL